MSICRTDTQRKLAEKAASDTAANPLRSNSQYNLMLGQLAQYKQRLKAIKSTQAKEQVKREELLPEMKAYVDGVLEADTGHQDDVVMHYMIWSFDAGDVDECLRVANYAVPHKLAMPDQFDSDLDDWLARAIAERTIKASEAGQGLDNTAFTAWSLVKDADLFDEVAAKLHKAMGLVLHNDRPELALTHYRTAVDLWDRVGAKKLITELEKQMPPPADKPA